jgi:hypothetical protein
MFPLTALGGVKAFQKLWRYPFEFPERSPVASMNSKPYGERYWIRPFVLGVVVTLPLSLLTIVVAIKRERAAMLSASHAFQVHPASEVHDGPGGRIEALRIPLANPGGQLPDQTCRLKAATWFFEGYSEDRLDRWLRSLRLPTVQFQILLDRHHWTVVSNGCIVTPPPKLIWSLPPDVRQQIYDVLARSPQNYPQQAPFRFPPGRFGADLRAAGLSAQRVLQLEQLTYTNGGTVCFADLQAAREVFTDDEFEDLVENLYLVPTYRLRLRVAPDTDLNALLDYWGKHGRANLIHPMLKGLTRVPNGASIYVPFLLPPYPRLRLYTYPQSWSDETAQRQDCVYTALNFFNETPNTNFFDRAYVQKVLASEYVQVRDEQPKFGDIVMLLDPANMPLHFCVYIVADFVFTKNGINDAQPWVFMNMQDVLFTYYGPNIPRHVVILRHIDTEKQTGGAIAKSDR